MTDPAAISLSGEWEFRFDGDDAWRPLRVPGCWEELDGVAKDRPGPAWYRHYLTIPAGTQGTRWWLRFGGVSYDCVISVNGREVGRHRGIWDAFVVEVTAAVTPGQRAELLLRVEKPASLTAGPDSAAVAGSFPLRETLAGFLPYVWGHIFGGVWQDVTLPTPQPWSPNEPALYEARLEVADRDAHVAPFGLRTPRVQGTTILLNGRSIYPRMALSWGAWIADGDRAAYWDTWSYLAGATVRPHLLASHYGRTSSQARVRWSGEATSFACGESATAFTVAAGSLRELTTAEFVAPREAVLRASVRIGGDVAHNSWPLWVFPHDAWAMPSGVALSDPTGRFADLGRIAPGARGPGRRADRDRHRLAARRAAVRGRGWHGHSVAQRA